MAISQFLNYCILCMDFYVFVFELDPVPVMLGLFLIDGSSVAVFEVDLSPNYSDIMKTPDDY